MTYTIIDVETTGRTNRMTEIYRAMKSFPLRRCIEFIEMEMPIGKGCFAYLIYKNTHP